MTPFNPPLPTAADFVQLGSIWRREADGREALGKALKTVLGHDLGLAAEAANLRRRAQEPQRAWPALVFLHSPTSPVTQRADNFHPKGLYGPVIATAAKTRLQAATCCVSCQAALQVTAAALEDLSGWLDRHVHPSTAVAARAAWDVIEANHLAAWANRLRAEALQAATTGIAT